MQPIACHRLWRRAFSKDIAAESGDVYGLWQSDGRVVVLTGQVCERPAH